MYRLFKFLQCPLLLGIALALPAEEHSKDLETRTSCPPFLKPCGTKCCGPEDLCLEPEGQGRCIELPPPKCLAWPGSISCGGLCCDRATELCIAGRCILKPIIPHCDFEIGERACGNTCCSSIQRCDPASLTCKMPPLVSPPCNATVGEHLCGRTCCARNENCMGDFCSVTTCEVWQEACGNTCCDTPLQTCDHSSGTCKTGSVDPPHCDWLAGEHSCGLNGPCCKRNEDCLGGRCVRRSTFCPAGEMRCGEECCNREMQVCDFNARKCKAKAICNIFAGEARCGPNSCCTANEICLEGSCVPRGDGPGCGIWQTPCGNQCCKRLSETCENGLCKPTSLCSGFGQMKCGDKCCNKFETCEDGVCKPGSVITDPCVLSGKQKCGDRCCRLDQVCIGDGTCEDLDLTWPIEGDGRTGWQGPKGPRPGLQPFPDDA